MSSPNRPGRRSAASFEVPSVRELRPRPEPLDELNAEEAVVWRATAARMPADWFTQENFPLLVCYCRSVCSARDLASRRKAGLSLEELDLVLGMLDRERRAIESLATKMRLTQQSRYSKRKSPGPVGPRPWEPDAPNPAAKRPWE